MEIYGYKKQLYGKSKQEIIESSLERTAKLLHVLWSGYVFFAELNR